MFLSYVCLCFAFALKNKGISIFSFRTSLPMRKVTYFQWFFGGFRKTIEINKDQWHFLNAMIFGRNGKRHWEARGSKHITFPMFLDGFCKTIEITQDQ